MVTLDTGDILTVLFGLIALLISVGAAMVAAIKAGKSADEGVAAKLLEKQQDREWMERVEKAYQASNAQQQALMNTAVALLQFVSPLTTGIKADDAALNLLRDMQKPGAPESASASSADE